MRKQIASYGTHGKTVRVFSQTFDGARQDLVRVEWREHGKKRMDSLPLSRDNIKKARGFAEGTANRLAAGNTTATPKLTMRELGELYVNAHPVGETWRPKTLSTFLDRWNRWMTYATPEARIDTITEDTLDLFRKALREDGHEVNQIVNHVQLVKSVYRFAKRRKKIAENPIADYEMKLSRDQRRLNVPEWSEDECARIIAQLSPKSSRDWRAYVAIVLDALLGGRSNAMLHLEIADIDMAARTLHWRPELDKLGKDRVQPLPRDAVRALRIAAVWRRRIGYTGKYVIPSGVKIQRGESRELKAWELDPKHKRIGKKGRRKAGDKPFSYSGLHSRLKDAADAAGVTWIPYRAMHGFRRMALNNVLALTGNLVRAGQWIGDTDARTLSRSYVRERPEDMRDVAAGMSLAKQVKP